MAGAVSKTFGALLVIVGVVALLAGMGGAGYAYFDEQDNQDRLIPDADRTELNEQLMIGAAIAAAVGILAAILGAIFIGIGSGRSQRAMIRAMTEGRSTASPAQDDAQTETSPTAPPPRYVKPLLVVAVVALVAMAGLAAAYLGIEAAGPSDADDGPSAATGDLGEEVYYGNITGGANTPLIPVNLDPSGDNGADFSPPEGATRFEAVLSWTPASGGAETLLIEISVGGDVIADAEGAGPLSLAGSFPVGSTLHYAVFSTADAPVTSQPFKLTVHYYA